MIEIRGHSHLMSAAKGGGRGRREWEEGEGAGWVGWVGWGWGRRFLIFSEKGGKGGFANI